LKTALALVAVLFVAACAATGSEPAGSAASPVKYDGGNVIDSQGTELVNSKF
jgi:hypothetical protein